MGRAKVRGKDALFIVLIETQSQEPKENDEDFDRRMFKYVTRLHEKYSEPIFPIGFLTFDCSVYRPNGNYEMRILSKQVLRFDYELIELKGYISNNFRQSRNPIAAALMAVMKFANYERAEVKYNCHALLSRFRLPEKEQRIILWFVDQYLKLNEKEKSEYSSHLARAPRQMRKAIMDTACDWELEGRKEEATSLVLRLIAKRFGPLNGELDAQLGTLSLEETEDLVEAIMDLRSKDDLVQWFSKRVST